MPTPDHDVDFADHLVAYDEALRAGLPAPDDTPVSAELEARLEGARACLRRLRQEWPTPGSRPGTEKALPLDVPLPGNALGRFHILSPVGRGGQGVVYRAWDPRLRRQVALKVARPEMLADADLHARFRREAEAAAGLDHPNLVPVYEVGEAGPWVYIVSAYCNGPSLAAWLKERREPVPMRRAAGLVADLATAVHYMHERGVVHRDIKPSNILMQISDFRFEISDLKCESEISNLKSEIPRLTDFGLAKLTDGSPFQTQTGAVIGTPAYMSPEQAAGRGRESGRAIDVYALGVVLYELLTGRPPFLGETAVDLLRQVLSREPVPPRLLRPGLPADLETICLKCLEKEPGKRYATAGALVDDLRSFLQGRPISARPVGRAEQLWRWCRRNPVGAGWVASVLVLLVAGTALSSYLAVRAEHKATEAEENATRADRETERVRQARRRSDERLYVADLRLVQRAWDDAQTARFVELLQGQCPEHTDGVDLRGFEWHYWNRRYHSEILALSQQQVGIVRDMAFSPDGQFLAVASVGRNTITIWDLVRGQRVLVLRGHEREVTALAYSADGRRIAAHGSPLTLCVWDAVEGTRLLRLREVRARTQPMFSPDGSLLAYGTEEGICVLDAASGRQRKCLPLEHQIPSCVGFSADGRSVASGSVDGRLTVWDLKSGRVRLTRRAAGTLLGVEFRRHDEEIVTASPDGVKTWGARSGAEISSVPASRAGANRVVLRAAADRVAYGTGDGLVVVEESRAPRVRSVLRAHPNRVWTVALSSDGRRLASADDAGGLRVWDVARGQNELVLRPGQYPVHGVAISPDGRYVVAASTPVKVWDLTSGRELVSLRPFPRGSCCWSLTFSPDGRYLAGRCNAGILSVLQIATQEEVFRLGLATGRCDVAFSPDGQSLATGAGGNTVGVWDCHTGRQIQTLQGHRNPVWSVAFSSDGQSLASTAPDNTVRIWDLTTGQERLRIPAVGFQWKVTFSLDSARVAATGLDGSARIWDAQTGAVLQSFRGHTAPVTAVAFSPDGKRLCTASQDQTVRVWEVQTGQELLILRGHRGPVPGVAFTPDGTRLVSGGEDGTVRIWDATPLPAP